MHTENFISLYTMDYHLTSIFAMRQYWSHKGFYAKKAPRPTSCLLYFCGCSGRYYEKGRSFTVPKGSVVYIPEGAVYKTDFFEFDDNPIDTILIEFGLLLPSGEHFTAADSITVLQNDSDALLDRLFSLVVDEQAAAVVSVASIKASIYQLLNHLSRTRRQQKILSPRFLPIAKGINYLENDPRQEKSIQEIADMCFVSPAYFRRLFKEYAGANPTEYRLLSRIEYAKKLLRLGTMTTVEVAREVGFDDPAYFCRIFKKRCGVSPGNYIRSAVK